MSAETEGREKLSCIPCSILSPPSAGDELTFNLTGQFLRLHLHRFNHGTFHTRNDLSFAACGRSTKPTIRSYFKAFVTKMELRLFKT